MNCDELCVDGVGWAEALGQEFEFISHQWMMSVEESRIIKHRLTNCQSELLELFLELEENELEYDEVDGAANNLNEKTRLLQLQRAEHNAKTHINRLKYRERVHWKIDSVRVNKMRSMRFNYQNIIKEVCHWLRLTVTDLTVHLFLAESSHSSIGFLHHCQFRTKETANGIRRTGTTATTSKRIKCSRHSIETEDVSSSNSSSCSCGCCCCC
jgi:hypothetical protein